MGRDCSALYAWNLSCVESLFLRGITNIKEKNKKSAMDPCSTPLGVGTGPDSQYGPAGETPSGSGKPSSSAPSSRIEETTMKETSSTTTRNSDGVCLVCALGTKGSHTYEKECKRYVKGATIAQMQRAARGGMKGRHRLLLELALQRSDTERGRTETSAEASVTREASSTSSSSSTSTSSPRTTKRSTSSKRKAGPQQTSRRLEEKKKIDPKDEGKKQTSAGKKRKIESNTETRERSPDMVEEILAWQGPRERGDEDKLNTKTEAKEDTRNKKAAPSGNTKMDKKKEVSKRQERPKVPPPASARADETKIDEVAVAKLEAAREMQKSTTAETPSGSGYRQKQPDTGNVAHTRINQERPASPMRPGEETPIEGESDIEKMVTEDEKPTKSGEIPRPDWKWRSETKPAEPAQAPRHIDVEQAAYLVLWFRKSKACRKEWEKSWSADQTSKDEEELARRLYSLDKRVEEGTTYAELRKTLKTLQCQEEEKWQTENSDGGVTMATDASYKTAWEYYSWNN